MIGLNNIVLRLGDISDEVIQQGCAILPVRFLGAVVSFECFKHYMQYLLLDIRNPLDPNLDTECSKFVKV